jgi:uncharacterized repeat protein (TIGR01451 family)
VKGFSSFLTLGWLVLAMIVASPRANAQGFGLSVTPSANSILVSNSLTYTINVTNLTGFDLADALVTNTLSAPFLYVVVTAPPQVLVFTNATSVRFDLGQVVNGGFVQITLTLQPTTTGFFTNAVVVANTSTIDTASNNVVVQVTNLVILADLGVTMTGPSQVVITNDWMTYGVTATNLGPSAASNVALTNSLPTGVLFKGIFPTNQSFTTAGSNMIFNLGRLTNGGYANLQFTVEPTNAGVLPFSASIGAAGVLDTNIANNFASTNITITNYLPGLLVAVTNSAQYINLVNGLEEQSILLSNTGTSSVTAARVVVTGLTNQLFNAVGTNNGNPFVYYSTNLAAGQSVSLLLQYFPRGPFPFTNNQLNAFEVSVPNWTPPSVTTTSTNVNISRIVELNNGWMLIEFPTTLGRTYTVVYSDNVLFSNAMIAPPSLVAPANRVQWIDYGPPTTVSAPTNASTRFYRVFQNP